MNVFFFRTKDDSNEPVMAVINLFGSIDCANSTHEVRGLNVIVRLYKSFPIMWPRLLYAGDKVTWIEQNLEKCPEDRPMEHDVQNPIGTVNISQSLANTSNLCVVYAQYEF